MATLPFYLEQFTYQDGVTPLAGGTLNFYTAGTVNALPVYTDHLHTIPVNPVTLNAGGRAPQFFAPSGSLYKVVIKAADGSLIDTRDWVDATGGEGGSVSSVTAQFDVGLASAMAVTSSPVTSSGAIDIEGVASAPNQALMTPASTPGKPSMRQIQKADVQGLQASLDGYLPLAGGTMDDTGLIQYAGTADAFAAGMYWGGDEWARISRWGLIWSAPDTRGGFELYPTYGAAYFALKRAGGTNDVEIYGHGDGGYANLRGANGYNAISFGAEPTSGNGSIYAANGFGQETFSHSSSSPPENSATRVQILDAMATIRTSGTIRLDQAGSLYANAVYDYSQTINKLPRIASNFKQVASCFGDDGTNATCTRPLTLNGATRPAWSGVFSGTTQETDLVSVGVQTSNSTQHVGMRMNNIYWDGSSFRVIRTSTNSWPALLALGYDALWYATDTVNPTAGEVPTMTTKWSVDRFGNMIAAGTITSAGSLVATRATKTREANIHFLPLTNNAPPVVNFVDANMKAWGFNGATQVQDLFSSIDMQHDYIAGTDLDLHIHWAPSTGTGGNVKWQFYVQWTEMSGTWAAATLYTTTVAAGSTAWVSGVASVTIPGTGHTYNSRLMIRLVRDPTDAADTYADPACVTAIGCHYSTDIGQ
jgi:hypothetical protein